MLVEISGAHVPAAHVCPPILMRRVAFDTREAPSLAGQGQVDRSRIRTATLAVFFASRSAEAGRSLGGPPDLGDPDHLPPGVQA